MHDPEQAAAIIGQTAQLELYDLSRRSSRRRSTRRGGPVATTSLYDLLSRVQSGARRARRAQYYLFKPVKITTTTGTGKNEEDEDDDRLREGASRSDGDAAPSDTTTGNAGLLDDDARQGPDGLQGADGAGARRS